MLNKAELQKTLDAFMKKNAPGYSIGTIKYISDGRKVLNGNTVYDVVTYLSLLHGEELGIMSNVYLDSNGSITLVNVWDHDTTVGSQTVKDLLRQWNDIPADEVRSKSYKPKTMKTFKEIRTEARASITEVASNHGECIKRFENLKKTIEAKIKNTTTGDYQSRGNKAGDFIDDVIDPTIEILKGGNEAKIQKTLRDFQFKAERYANYSNYGYDEVKDLIHYIETSVLTENWMSDSEGKKKIPSAIRDGVPTGAKVYIQYMDELADFYAYNDFKGGIHFWNVDKGEWTWAKNLKAAQDGHLDAIDDRTSYEYTY